MKDGNSRIPHDFNCMELAGLQAIRLESEIPILFKDHAAGLADILFEVALEYIADIELDLLLEDLKVPKEKR